MFESQKKVTFTEKVVCICICVGLQSGLAEDKGAENKGVCGTDNIKSLIVSAIAVCHCQIWLITYFMLVIGCEPETVELATRDYYSNQKRKCSADSRAEAA